MPHQYICLYIESTCKAENTPYQNQRHFSNTKNLGNILMAMQKILPTKFYHPLRQMKQGLAASKQCDVFINHRGVDTKRTVAGLLYDRLLQFDLHPFLDSRSMEPGDKLFESIGSAIRNCKVGIAVFSPRYCESYFCLHELARLVESKKKVIPIFCDVKPSELQIISHERCTAKEIVTFRKALEEAKYTVGLTFDSQNGNWSDLISSTTDIILKRIAEVN